LGAKPQVETAKKTVEEKQVPLANAVGVAYNRVLVASPSPPPSHSHKSSSLTPPTAPSTRDYCSRIIHITPSTGSKAPGTDAARYYSPRGWLRCHGRAFICWGRA